MSAQGETKQKRDWTEKQLLDSVLWLKRMNARGHDVLVRPSGQPCLTLLDRFTQAEVEKLERSGVPCSAKIQVEEDRFQIWLHLGTAAVSERLREAIADKLELPLVNGAKFGKLAGFVCHQSEAQGDRSRFVLAHEPVKPGTETVAMWERVLEETDKLIRAQERDNSHSRSKGLSR